jgi:PIN domain nuclease of toxin-antitoxin system
LRLLLDTCALIWWFMDDPRLGPSAAQLIEDAGTETSVSVVSLWEIAMKRRLGRHDLPVAVLDAHIRAAGWRSLPVLPAHLTVLENLPPHHRDPFDHLLISQAIAEDMTLMTCDAQVTRYAAHCIVC